ncbi:MAG TPA: phosphoribosylaminoimidazolesuccinocarboxamide synthase [Candidatus Omnitrophota bacterium]|jgi:phosphoribosylaminoimidazole-succinocarboxamide synthase|nr:phosphoribosylaminoimidazolesuccinocarboxamide synthase [Candidatus Omnitrophota bacterium]HPN56595.1 phosphoribosylaminoimidazolesuccinocarboxamide synthase [Candidatus Omnitrophota bacterium]
MEKLKKIYEGKAKILYETDSPDYIIQYFKDDATAFNAAKKGTIRDKGVVNNKISSKVFELLESEGIPTHFEKMLSDREMLVKRVEIVPLEVIVRNVAAGSLCRLLGLEEGTALRCPTLEFSYKEDRLNDPMINEYHIRALGLSSDAEMEAIKGLTFRINDIMTRFFKSLNIILVDFKLEFGRYKGQILLADEISPDTCRLWEMGSGRRLDKDRFRKDLGEIEEAYQEVLCRVSR